MKGLNATTTLLVTTAAGFLGVFTLTVEGTLGPTEAPAAFDNQTTD
jgi:hypothetical protein